MPSRTHSSNLHVIWRWSALPWGSAVGLKVSARCSEATRSHVDGWISGELQLCCCTATKKSRVRAWDLIPTYHTGRAALSCCRPPISEGHPISMVCSRSGVRLYAATPRSGPGLLCAAARFVSAKQQGNDGFFILRLMRYTDVCFISISVGRSVSA